MIYTIGYTGLPVEQLAQVLLRQQALLCDIRFSPHSRNPAYTQAALRKSALSRAAGISRPGQSELPWWGDRHRGLPHRTATGAEVLQDWPAVLLLCACADVQQCHRKGRGEQLAWDLGQRCVHQRLPQPGRVPADVAVLGGAESPGPRISALGENTSRIFYTHKKRYSMPPVPLPLSFTEKGFAPISRSSATAMSPSIPRRIRWRRAL